MADDVTDDTPALRIVPAADAPFTDVEQVFGTKGDAAHCWCQWFMIEARDWRAVGDEGLRQRLEGQLAEPGPGRGLLAYDGDEPVGWCAVEPRRDLPRLRRSRAVVSGTTHPDFDDETVWAVSCFVIPRAHRGRGIGRALARAAIGFAREHGATTLEAYAVDPSARSKPSAEELFHGTVSMFADAGFAEVARTTTSRVVMEHRLAGRA
ncbi:GNAT family N-acetyltransferase [Agromyces sp. G08B096]|uniref:GNAT family N-acetyltransferase n=1 Tax=Agromyces sp. G08B096 TaxID=3156399 RepID=A0AAU7W259_9MICO